MTFEIGDRVEALVHHIEMNGTLLEGDTGTVVDLLMGEEDSHVGVEWDKKCSGHDCRGHAEYGHGWNVRKREIRLIQSVETHDVEVDNSDLFTMLAIGGACL